jgi:hypothetical protein
VEGGKFDCADKCLNLTIAIRSDVGIFTAVDSNPVALRPRHTFIGSGQGENKGKYGGNV